MKKEFVLLGVIVIAAVFNLSAFAENVQVYITNSSSTKECAYSPSCFLPYQITVTKGGTVTWINLDNKTHTATTGTSNYGPVGYFDSGIINPGKSYTQFFGTIGKYSYFDKINPWVTGVVLVVSGKSTHAELAWEDKSLKILDKFGNQTSTPIQSQPITIVKDITNSGDTDAASVFFRLKIMNATNYLLYDKFIYVDIGAKQTVPIGFSWQAEKSGVYHLLFDANPSNPIGDTNANNDASFDTVTIFSDNSTNNVNSTSNTSSINDTNLISAVPEFGTLAVIILVVSIIFMITMSAKMNITRN